ncbi:MAG: ribosome biogenesis GTPase YlqF [Acholeplasmataceae bacterium]
MNQQTDKQIQWYPGHMFKSLREIREKISLMDMVMILLDARLPVSSMNPEILKIVKHKPVLILLNKMDLADPRILSQYVIYFQEQGYATLAIDANKKKNINKIYSTSVQLLEQKFMKQANKGLKQRAIRTMILGIPNVGKSTLINALAQKKATKTGNTPGVTKTQQWIKLSSEFELLDTPGVLWPKFDDKKVAYHLAITGAIKDHILPLDDVCQYAVEFLKENYFYALASRYQITKAMTFAEMLDQIGKVRGALLKGNEINYDRVYQIILTDIRGYQLGGLSFDRL